MRAQALDWPTIQAKARGMTGGELFYARQDCTKAAEAMDALERAGCRCAKGGGYYRDEASVYRMEAERRALRAA